MAGSKLQVGIGADVSDFKKKISEVEFDLKELSKLKIERIKLGLDTSEINNQIKDVKKTLRDLKSTTADAGNSFGTFNKKTADGGAALTSFSRIAQDAPYGIIGVGNNITNTAEQFGYLVKETGSAGGAIKAMLSSLAGVGGVLLGVSLLTTGLTLMAQQGLTVSDVLDKLTGQYDEFGQTIKKASEEGAKAAGSEVSALQSLVAVAQNDALSKKERLIAVDKLQKQFPGYFGQLSDEKILYGDLTKVTKEATKALVERAIAEKLIENNADIFVERLKANARYRKAADELNEFDKKSEKELAGLKNVSAAQIAIIQAKQLNTRNDLIDKVNEERNNIIKLTAAYDRLQNVINQLKGSSINLEQEPLGAPKKEKKFNTPQVSKANTGISGGGLIDLTQLEFTTGKVDEFGNKLKELPGTISTAFTGIKEITGKGFTDLELASIDFVNNFNSIFANLAQSGLANLGTSIGEALATGNDVLQVAGQSILQTFSSFLSQLGDQLIKLGLAAVLTGTVLKSIGTISGVGAGLAAIAGGVALKAIAGGINASAQRGIGGGGSFSTRGGSNSSFSSSSGGFQGGGLSGNVVFEISGQKLIGVLNNTLNGNKRLGGAVGLG